MVNRKGRVPKISKVVLEMFMLCFWFILKAGREVARFGAARSLRNTCTRLEGRLHQPWNLCSSLCGSPKGFRRARGEVGAVKRDRAPHR